MLTSAKPFSCEFCDLTNVPIKSCLYWNEYLDWLEKATENVKNRKAVKMKISFNIE
jgi:hypothetical protein